MKKLYLIIILFMIAFGGCKSSNLVDPSAMISYSVPELSHVKLTVENNYNTAISILVDDKHNAGLYNVSFNITDLAEGIYFYTIEIQGLQSDFYSKTTEPLFLAKQ